jgi:hypothetical protein
MIEKKKRRLDNSNLNLLENNNEDSGLFVFE